MMRRWLCALLLIVGIGIASYLGMWLSAATMLIGAMVGYMVAKIIS